MLFCLFVLFVVNVLCTLHCWSSQYYLAYVLMKLWHGISLLYSFHCGYGNYWCFLGSLLEQLCGWNIPNTGSILFSILHFIIEAILLYFDKGQTVDTWKTLLTFSFGILTFHLVFWLYFVSEQQCICRSNNSNRSISKKTFWKISHDFQFNHFRPPYLNLNFPQSGHISVSNYKLYYSLDV